MKESAPLALLDGHHPSAQHGGVGRIDVHRSTRVFGRASCRGLLRFLHRLPSRLQRLRRWVRAGRAVSITVGRAQTRRCSRLDHARLLFPCKHRNIFLSRTQTGSLEI